MRTPKRHLLLGNRLAAICLALVIGGVPLCAQEGGVIPASYHGSGSFFNRQLGTALRFNYHTQGYGTRDDVLSLGAMKVFSQEGAIWYLDGQGTLSDGFGSGFNLGVGYRQHTLSTSPLMRRDPERIMGLSFWTDGQSTSADNFFTQLGFSLESLGDSYDMRVNGHFPLDRTKTSAAVLSAAGLPVFGGNEIFGAAESFYVDTAHTVVDSEFAKRITDDLEAWAFFGTYHIWGGSLDATGYRMGVRGYAVPDVAMSLQVTDDSVYATNVVFGITWFVGRTNRYNSPCGTILDRFREPVLRNDFIATTSQRRTRAAGDPLTIQGTNDAFNIVHVNSSAGLGGDGTFENPFQSLTQVDSAPGTTSQENSIILAHGGSAFAGGEGQIVLQDGQRILGEGLDSGGNAIAHLVDTNELNVIVLPETAPGAQGLARPMVDATGSGVNVITMADNNIVNNLTIDDAVTAIMADGVAAPTLANLDITDASGDAVVLRNVTGTPVVENTVAIVDALRGLVVDGGFTDLALAATIRDAVGTSLDIRNRTGGTVTYSGLVEDSGAGNGGVVIRDNVDAAVAITNTTTVNTGNSDAVVIDNNNVGTTITFNDLIATAGGGRTLFIDGGGTVNIDDINGTSAIVNNGTGSAVENDGDPDPANNATVTIAADVTNSGGGRAIDIQNRTGNTITFSGTVDETGNGLLVTGNTGGTIAFGNLVSSTVTGFNHAVDLSTNPGATIGFTGVNLRSDQGTAFRAIGGGNLLVVGPTDATNSNTIDTTGGVGVEIDGITIENVGVSFDTVNVTNGSTNGIVLNNTTGIVGARIRVGAGTATGTDGDGGTLSTAGTAILVTEVADAVFNDVTAESLAGSTVTVDNLNTSDSAIVFDNLSLISLAGAGDGVVVTDSGTGELDFVLRNSTLDTTASNTVAFDFNTQANAGEVDIRIEGNTIAADNSFALHADISQGSGDIQFLIENNSITNNSAASATVDFLVTTDRTLNATIGDQTGVAPFDANSFTNSSAGGDAVAIESNSAAARINLDLRGNTATAGGMDFLLTETAGVFGVVDRSATITLGTTNQGVVDLGGGGVEADFDVLAPPIKQVD
ncbi:MAG: hypothetical protein MK171_05085 [Pirellulales bacterium]|nr:hypothetical protein [Pirellulales bacterium]